MGTPPQLQVLVERRREFLRFLERRLGSEAAAEDLLQDALLKSIDRAGEIDEAARVGWFYKVLENAVIDHHRRKATAARGLEQLGEELRDASETVDDAPARTCRCVAKLRAELKPEYAQALERVEVDEVPVKDFAAEAGISASNAGVRVFRAREALKKKVEQKCGFCAKAGCVDCSCVS